MTKIEEAISRGYKTGTVIDYEFLGMDNEVLGCGEFCLEDDRLIKYEKELKNDNDHLRRFDTIWSKEEGWTKIVKTYQP